MNLGVKNPPVHRSKGKPKDSGTRRLKSSIELSKRKKDQHTSKRTKAVEAQVSNVMQLIMA